MREYERAEAILDALDSALTALDEAGELAFGNEHYELFITHFAEHYYKNIQFLMEFVRKHKEQFCHVKQR